MQICEICKKKPLTGNSITRKGISKKKGGIGLNTTGIARRRFMPNIQKVRAIVNGGVKRIRVCTSCIQAGKIEKAFRRKKTVA